MTSKHKKKIDRNDGSAIIQSVIAKIKKETKTLLHPMSVDFPEGKITAILGPSGERLECFHLEIDVPSFPYPITFRTEIDLKTRFSTNSF